MGLVNSNCLQSWREAFEYDRNLGLVQRRKTFEDVVRDIKLQEGWGAKGRVTKKPVDISLDKLSIKDAICEKPEEDDSTDAHTSHLSESDLNSSKTVQVYQSKDKKAYKTPALQKSSSLEPIINNLQKLLGEEGLSTQTRASKRAKPANSSIPLNRNLIAFRNLVDSKERLRNKIDSMRKIKQWDSPMTAMSMRFL